MKQAVRNAIDNEIAEEKTKRQIKRLTKSLKEQIETESELIQLLKEKLKSLQCMESLIIKRQRFNTYHEVNIVCNSEGKGITRESNLNKRIRYGNKTYFFNGKKYNVFKW